MNAQQLFHAHRMFQLLVHSKKGEAFQDLFSLIMEKAYPEFVRMRPYGNLGDKKNDGYIPSTGTYFQVYAPEDPEARLAEAARKAQRDFVGLKQHWHQKNRAIKSYHFVFNDVYRGSVVPLEDALNEITVAHGVDARPFLARHLEETAFTLSQDGLQQVLGCPILDPLELSSVDFNAMRDVVEGIMASTFGMGGSGKLLAPELDAKISHNKLSPQYRDYIRSAAYQTDAVESYLSNLAPSFKQTICDRLEEIYMQAKADVIARGGGADDVFALLIQRCLPPGQRLSPGVHTAVMVLLSFYFESCDIFEAPNVPA